MDQRIKERWLPVAILGGGLFAMNIVVRLIVRLVADTDEDKQTWIGAIAMAALGLVVLVVAVRWVVRHPIPRVVGSLAVAIAGGSLLSALTGPFVSSGEAFSGGFGGFLVQLFLYCAVCALGGLLGTLGVMVAGRDLKSQSWQRYAEAMKARPQRPVRR